MLKKINSRSPPMQTFNDGVLAIYAIERHPDGSETLTPKHELLRYDERTVGIGRYYRAKHENAEITRVLRVPRHNDISTQDVAVATDGQQYNIRQVQYPKEATPACCDLSVERVTQNYDIERA